MDAGNKWRVRRLLWGHVSTLQFGTGHINGWLAVIKLSTETGWNSCPRGLQRKSTKTYMHGEKSWRWRCLAVHWSLHSVYSVLIGLSRGHSARIIHLFFLHLSAPPSLRTLNYTVGISLPNDLSLHPVCLLYLTVEAKWQFVFIWAGTRLCISPFDHIISILTYFPSATGHQKLGLHQDQVFLGMNKCLNSI